jgi:serine protease Do
MKKILNGVLFILLTITTFAFQTTEEAIVQLAEEVLPSVVNIKVTAYSSKEQRFGQAIGSGFVISEDGYVLTNNHVVSGAVEISVSFEDGREFGAKLLGKDPDIDVALLQIKSDEKFKPVKIGNSDNIKVGQWALSVGNPHGFNNTLTLGIISATGRSGYGIGTYEDYIQTDAAINQGNSGGPLFNSKGEVVGINTAIISETGGNIGIGFAIPINIAAHAVEFLKDGKKVKHSIIGVALDQNYNIQKAKYLGLDGVNGALVLQVGANTPAQKAGMQRGDVILEIDERKVNNYSHAQSLIANKMPGEKITFKIWRNGKMQILEVVAIDRANFLR